MLPVALEGRGGEEREGMNGAVLARFVAGNKGVTAAYVCLYVIACVVVYFKVNKQKKCVYYS